MKQVKDIEQLLHSGNNAANLFEIKSLDEVISEIWSVLPPRGKVELTQNKLGWFDGKMYAPTGENEVNIYTLNIFNDLDYPPNWEWSSQMQ